MDDTFGQMTALAEGLVYISETDAPLEGFQWEGMEPFSPEALRQQENMPEDTSVEIVTVEHFFRNAINPDLYGTDAARFQALIALMQSRLVNLHVYRFGTNEIQVYIVGQAADGETMGLTTRVVEK